MEKIMMCPEVPSAVHGAMQDFLESNPSWDSNRFVTVAMALLALTQNPNCKEVQQVYDAAMFGGLDRA
jgi:Protein of unknown function (DUF2811)